MKACQFLKSLSLSALVFSAIILPNVSFASTWATHSPTYLPDAVSYCAGIGARLPTQAELRLAPLDTGGLINNVPYWTTDVFDSTNNYQIKYKTSYWDEPYWGHITNVVGGVDCITPDVVSSVALFSDGGTAYADLVSAVRPIWDGVYPYALLFIGIYFAFWVIQTLIIDVFGFINKKKEEDDKDMKKYREMNKRGTAMADKIKQYPE